MHDSILRYLKISVEKAIVLAEDKNKSTPKLDRVNSSKFWLENDQRAQTVRKPTILTKDEDLSQDKTLTMTGKKEDLWRTPVFEDDFNDSDNYDVV